MDGTNGMGYSGSKYTTFDTSKNYPTKCTYLQRTPLTWIVCIQMDSDHDDNPALQWSRQARLNLVAEFIRLITIGREL